jgi:hypothetical protein
MINGIKSSTAAFNHPRNLPPLNPYDYDNEALDDPYQAQAKSSQV